VRIAGAYEQGFDLLALTAISPTISPTIAPVWDAANGELILSGAASFAEYQAVLRIVAFTNTSENPNTATRAIEITVFDGLQSSDTLKTSLIVQAVNDAPTLNAMSVVNSNEDTQLFTSIFGLTVADVDSADLVLTMQVTKGSFAWVSAGLMPAGIQIVSANEVQFSGIAAQINTWASNFAFSPDADFNGEANVQWSLTDLGKDAVSANSATTMVITPINDSPLWQGTFSLNVDQGRQFLLSRANTQAIDIEDTSSQLFYELVELPSYGQLIMNGQVLNNTSRFTQLDIDQRLVSYQHDNSGIVADSFSFKVADSGGLKTAIQSIQLNIQASPVLIVTPPSGSGGTSTSPTAIASTVTDSTAGSTTSPPGSDGNTSTKSIDNLSAGGATAASGGVVASTASASQRSASKAVSSNEASMSGSTPTAPAESFAKGQTSARELAQASQDAVATISNTLTSQASAFAASRFDGLGFIRVKSQAELIEYSDFARATLRDKGFAEEVQKVRDDLNQTLKLDRNVAASATAVSASLSIGYVIWLVRGGALLSSLMASLPAWRMVDPLPILGSMGEGGGDDDSDDDSLDAMIDKYKAERVKLKPFDLPNPPSAPIHPS
jgi:hypothetical protein